MKVVIKIASFTYFPHSMAVGVFKFSPFFALITYAIVIGILFKVSDKRLNKLITEYCKFAHYFRLTFSNYFGSFSEIMCNFF
ncbi:hypothetical protein, partial [Bacillus alveayuensis]|uniref:hypothetical protein n=1 Tax=Aeribacillus alveayuensis TaxID=279215 RepID=UPI001F37B512